MQTQINWINLWNQSLCFIMAVLVSALMIPSVAFSQSTVDLRSADSFGLLAGAAISGASVITGNVGTPSGAIDATITTAPGYTVYTIGHADVLAAQTDLATAYNDAAGRTGATALGAEIGGLTLTPVVYNVAATIANMMTNLTLDGAGVYIFQIAGYLVTAASVEVVLTNGAVWTDIFWQVGSYVTTGASTTFHGTILGNSYITLGASTVVQGRMLSKNSYITLGAGCTVGGSEIPVPVELTSFTAALNNKAVVLNWNTATEVNNYGFEVQKLVDGSKKTEWNTIGFVRGNGNSNSPKSYSFIDDKINAGKYSYRLKQIDNDGRFEYSKVVEVDYKLTQTFELSQNYPNPFNPTTKINYTIPVDSRVQLLIYTITGELVKMLVNEYQTAGIYTVDFDAVGLPSGIYFYKISANNFLQYKKMIVLK